MLENLQIVICKLANDLIFLPNNWLGKIKPCCCGFLNTSKYLLILFFFAPKELGSIITLRNADESIDRKTLSILYLQIQTFHVLKVHVQIHYF